MAMGVSGGLEVERMTKDKTERKLIDICESTDQYGVTYRGNVYFDGTWYEMEIIRDPAGDAVTLVKDLDVGFFDDTVDPEDRTKPSFIDQLTAWVAGYHHGERRAAAELVTAVTEVLERVRRREDPAKPDSVRG